MFGNNYTITHPSDFDTNLAGLDLKTYFFPDVGLLATFAGSQLIVLQTKDILPKETNSTATLLSGCTSSDILSTGIVTMEETDKNKRYQLLVWSVVVGARTEKVHMELPGDSGTSFLFCLEDDRYCRDALNTLLEFFGFENVDRLINTGLKVMNANADAISDAEEACDSDPPKNVEGLTCPVKCTFTYSDWSECQPEGIKTRTVSKTTPRDASGNPDEPLTMTCTYHPALASIPTPTGRKCQPDGTRFRILLSTTPEGCIGGTRTHANL